MEDKLYSGVSDEFLANQRLLVVSPHADDESFGCAGTIAKIKKLGGEVFVLVMSVGDLKHYDGTGDVVKGSQRSEEFASVAEYLQIDDYDIFFTDAESHLRLDAMPLRDLISVIDTESKVSIDRIKPTMVALPAISYNQDHVATFKAGFTACRPHDPSVKSFPKIVLSYDNQTLFWNVDYDKFHPSFYVDISDFLDVKLKALSLHKSQLRHSPHHCSIENMEYLARTRGHEISVAAAEAYVCHRFVV
jgi:LmbE family N-acetylglucosaminyl deacetylase